MIIARKLDAQYQLFLNFSGRNTQFVTKLDQTTRTEREILGFIFKVIIGITSEGVSASIKHRQNKSL